MHANGSGNRPVRHRSRTQRLVRLSALWLLFSFAAFAEDWPTYMRDARRSGVSGEVLPLDLALQWSYVPPAKPGRAWPGIQDGTGELPKLSFDAATHAVAAQGIVYFGSPVDNGIHALNLADGEPRWSHFTEGPVRLAPTVADGRVYAGSDDGNLYCLDAASGKLLWIARPFKSEKRMLGAGRLSSLFPIRTGVVVENGVVYVAGGLFPSMGTCVAAFAADTGKELWNTREIPKREAYVALAPQGYLLADNAQVIVPCSRTSPMRYAKADGAMRGSLVKSYDVVAGKGVVSGDYGILIGDLLWLGTQNVLYCYKPDGKYAGKWTNNRQLLAAPERYFALSGKPVSAGGKPPKPLPAVITAVDRPAFDAGGRKFERGAVPKGMVKWRFQADIIEAMIATAGQLVVGGAKQVVLLDAEAGKVLAKIPVEGVVRGLAAVDGRLLASTDDGRIHCLAAGAAAPKIIQAAGKAMDTAPVSALAAAIAKDAGLDRGFGLVLGAGQAPLAVELARQTGLLMHVAEADPGKAAAARAALAAAGDYGSRVLVEVIQPGEKTVLPYPQYFANLVVCPAGAAGSLPEPELLRVLKPSGGRLYTQGLKQEDKVWENAGISASPDLPGGGWSRLVRGTLPGAGVWTHQYADPGNSGCSEDKLVVGKPDVLWYGEPGADKVQERHRGSEAPLFLDGRVYLQGVREVGRVPLMLCFDAYNGIQYWERELPGAERIYIVQDCGNLALSAAGLFVATGKKCQRLDLRTGATAAVYEMPAAPAETEAAPVGGKTAWAFVAVVGDTLLGSTGMAYQFSNRVFAFDIPSGKLKWQYQGGIIRNNTLAADGGRVFFAEHRGATEAPKILTPMENAQKKSKEKAAADAKAKAAAAAAAKKKAAGNEDGEEHPDKPDDDNDEPPPAPAPKAAKAPVPDNIRTIVSLDLETGRELWAVDADTSNCGRWGGTMALIAKNDTVLLFGVYNAYGKRKGDEDKRRTLALSAKDGSTIWNEPLGNLVRPVVIGNRILSRPNGLDLQTGKPAMRPGKKGQEPWKIMPLGACGQMSASAHMLFYRLGNTNMMNAHTGTSVMAFLGMRPGCLINIIPAGGVIIQPEASSGCQCYHALQSTVVFVPPPPAPKKE